MRLREGGQDLTPALLRGLMRLLSAVLLVVLGAMPSAAGTDPYLQATQGHSQTVTAAFFGTHFHRLDMGLPDDPGRTRWPQQPLGHLRLWDAQTTWFNLQPAPERWQFQRLDAYVAAAEAAGVRVLLTLGMTPAWNSTRPEEPCPYAEGCSAEPRDLSAWKDYVRTLARRYGTRIAAYELWNEPLLSELPRDRGQRGFYTGSVHRLVAMAEAAREALDETVPGTPLCTPGFTNGVDRLALFLSAGGERQVQALCFHLYAESNLQLARTLVSLQRLQRERGLGALPLWNTETGVEVAAPGEKLLGGVVDSWDAAAARLAQALVLSAAAGVERFYQYAWDNGRSGLVDAQGRPRPALAAFTQVQDWLMDRRVGPCRQPWLNRPGLVACQTQGADGRHWLLWHTGPEPLRLRRAQLARALGARELRDPAQPERAAPRELVDVGQALVRLAVVERGTQ
ncbi:cellulase family glycosylhydrolase [Mitsuaria sp. WAJ17]|uniref:cellulase family glycosylhydrolase n=1 Tax=Mitsuaria sp. WAJ17 TaxID=2761452 RepID=UPI0015FF4ADF|nr:cellulase family glycosylhydrolase [Mitsuaria sp. WAJ17]MBB2484308.1 cellulase family glycosylhydrolase [Mitsuaria sp. WAJ17]